MATTRDSLAKFSWRNALLGRPQPPSTSAAVVQLAVISIGTIAIASVLELLDSLDFPSYRTLHDWSESLGRDPVMHLCLALKRGFARFTFWGVLLCWVVLGRVIFQSTMRQWKRPAAVYVQCLYRATQWYLMFGGVVFCFVLWRPQYLGPVQPFVVNAWVLCFLLGPSLVFLIYSRRVPNGHCATCVVNYGIDARGNCSTCGDLLKQIPRRLSRWRPECPECGYALRGHGTSRCSECGTFFPSSGRFFRRWAVRRLPWDRAERRFLASAYIRSVLLILFVPARAARGLSMPDRWGRVVRWSIAHMLLMAVAATLLMRDQNYVRSAVELISSMGSGSAESWAQSEFWLRSLLDWAAHGVVAWSVMCAALVAVGCGISLSMPGRHRAARLGGVKWSLSLTVLPLWVVIGWYVANLAYAFSWLNKAIPLRGPGTEIQDVPNWLLVATFAVWWSIGMASNLFARSRRDFVVVGYVVIYVAVWWVITTWVFPIGALGVLR